MLRLRIFLRDQMTSFRVILVGFILLILAGAFLLSLPIASASHVRTPFLDALFTSTSAACVTGLVVRDTATYWSLFGRTVILILIQIGGLGVVTVGVFMIVLSGKQIGIHQRTVMQEAISAPQIGGIIRFTKFFIGGTALLEALGMIALAPPFIREFGVAKGLSYALFHSISAFCNAGFDLMGIRGQYSSLSSMQHNHWVLGVIMALIVFGGIGFLTWRDLLDNRFRWRRLRLQTKIILYTTGVLLVITFLYFWLVEFRDIQMTDRIWYSLLAAVTPRTAGFNTFEYGAISEAGMLVTIVLMMTGGAPGSTAGGMKVTTLFAVCIAAANDLRRKEDVNCFGRRLDETSIHKAFSILFIYTALLMTGTAVITLAEPVPLIRAMFECASALGTVGLTTGITPGLGPVSKAILILFMYFGRVGGLTIVYAAVSKKKRPIRKYPMEKIAVG